MDRFNGIPDINGTEAEPVMIAEYNSIIFTIPSTSLQELIIFIGKVSLETSHYRIEIIILKDLNDDDNKEIFSIASNIFSVEKNGDELRNGFMNNFMAP